MDKKVALKELGWTDELIEHFMVDRFQSINTISNPVGSQIYESNTVTIKYEASQPCINNECFNGNISFIKRK